MKRFTFMTLQIIALLLFLSACAQENVTFDIDTTTHLPKEIAIQYLNDNTDCEFNDKGMILDSKTHAYNRLKYDVKNPPLGWTMGIYERRGITAPSCTAIGNLGSFARADDDTMLKIVTALESLGMDQYK